MIVYLDSSAALKQLREEAESAALRRWWDEHPEAEFESSRLLSTEVHRASVIYGIPRQRADAFLDTVGVIMLTDELLHRAAHVPAAPQRRLRSLDAIHLVSAQWADLTHMLTYDDQLAAAAEFHGLTVHAPR